VDRLVSAGPVVGAIVQARANSRRLPGKIFLKLPYGGAHTLVENIVLRARRAESLASVIVATSTGAANDPLQDATSRVSAPLFRGSEDDVLGRFIGAAEEHGLDVVVRLTGDNPCIDSFYIEEAIRAHVRGSVDYTKTTGLPIGMNVEVVSLAALKRASASSTRREDREHVTLAIANNPDQFALSTLDFARVEYRELRLTVDWPGDYAFACFVYEMLHSAQPTFGLPEIVNLLGAHPWARFINGSLKQERAFSTLDEELHEAIALLELYGHRKAETHLRGILNNRTGEKT